MPRSASGRRRLLLLAVWGGAAAALSEPERAQQAAARGARRLQDPALALRGTEPVAMQKHRLLGGRRHFYGRGCALVDVDGDVFPSNAALCVPFRHLREELRLGSVHEPKRIDWDKARRIRWDEVFKESLDPAVHSSTRRVDDILTGFVQDLRPRLDA